MVALLKMPTYLAADPWRKNESADVWSDRRLFPRKECRAQVRGRRLDNTLEARQEPWFSFNRPERPPPKPRRTSQCRVSRRWLAQRLGCLRTSHPLRSEQLGIPRGGGIRSAPRGVEFICLAQFIWFAQYKRNVKTTP